MLTYALVVSKQNSVENVFNAIKEFGEDHVSKAFVVYGEYDILAEVKAQNEAKMKELLNKIREMEGVVTLKTFSVTHKTRERDRLPQRFLKK